MNLKKLISLILTLLAVASFSVVAGNVTPSAAREIANGFLKSHCKSFPGSFNAHAMSDLVLAYAEPSDKVPQAKCYYIFNIKGGGFVIVSGEDHATPVLGYSDKGYIDILNLPEPLKCLLGDYKADIEYLLTHDIKTPKSFNQSIQEPSIVVAPMTKATWGQYEPYYNLCPMLNGKHSKVGCSAIALAQTLYFWQFPTSCDSLPSYFSIRLNDTVPALPPTVFNYDLILPSYAEWDMQTHSAIQGVYTEEQVYEVAKLCRYCGQMLKMNYSPTGSGSTVKRIDVFKNLGYNSRVSTIYRQNYNDSEWVELIKVELNAGRLVVYGGKVPVSGSPHAFIIDGYDSEDYLHVNWGWYGISDGWFQISAMIATYLDGTTRHYSASNNFLKALEPPLFCTIHAEVAADSGLHFLGETLTAQASDVRLSMSYRTLPFMFSLTDAEGNEVAVSESTTLNRLTFENGTDISLAITLPETLPDGTYDLHLNYRTAEGQPLTQALTSQGQLTIYGKFAKYGAPFSIDDVVDAIDMLLTGNFVGVQINITDVTMLIDYLLTK